MARPTLKYLKITEEFLDETYDELKVRLEVTGNLGRALKEVQITRMELRAIQEHDPRFMDLLKDVYDDFVDDREQELWELDLEKSPLVRLKMLAAKRPGEYDRSGVAQMMRARGVIEEQQQNQLIEGHFEDEKPKELENSAASKLERVRDAVKRD